LNFLLILPMAIAEIVTPADGRHSPELKVMLIIVLICALGPAVVGSVAVNLAGGLGSGAARLALGPDGIKQYLRSAMWACTLCALGVTVLYAFYVLMVGVPMTLVQWVEVLVTGIAGNIAFMQLGLITSLRAPKSVDLKSINGWNMYTFAGGVLIVGYMLAAGLYAFMVAYHGDQPFLAAVSIVASIVCAAMVLYGRSTEVTSSQQEAFLECLGGSSV
jgi:hypothetical protein